MIEEIIAQVILEMERQDAKWGDQSHKDLFEWNAIIGEEMGEVSKAVLEHKYLPTVRMEDIYTELIQTAAVAIQFARAVQLKQQRAREWKNRVPDQYIGKESILKLVKNAKTE